MVVCTHSHIHSLTHAIPHIYTDSDPIECSEPILVVSHKLGVCRVTPTGKPCYTHFTRLSYNGSSSVVKCKVQLPSATLLHNYQVLFPFNSRCMLLSSSSLPYLNVSRCSENGPNAPNQGPPSVAGYVHNYPSTWEGVTPT